MHGREPVPIPGVQRIAHDINNMLSSALANIQLSRRSCPHKEQVLGHLDNAERSVLRARDHSRQLLASVGTADATLSAGAKKTGRKAADQEYKKRPAARYRILLMDDEEAILSATSDMLTFLGHEVTVAENGDLAVSRYRTARETGSPFDAVILDITVPGGKGAGETLPLLRNINPQVRAVVSSGYATHPLVTGFAANGFVSALVKPYGFKELEDALSRALKNSLFYQSRSSCRDTGVVPAWEATISPVSSKKSPRPSRALARALSGVLLISLKCERITGGASLPSCRSTAAACRIREMTVIGAYPPFQGLRVRAVCEHVGAVVAFEDEAVAWFEAGEHASGNDPGIRTVPEGDAIVVYGKPAGLGRIVGSGKRGKRHSRDCEGFVVPADPGLQRLIRRASVAEEIGKRPLRCIDRAGKFPGKHIEPPDMVAVLVGHDNGFDRVGSAPGLCHPGKGLFCAQARIDEECAFGAFDIGTVALTPACKDSAPHSAVPLRAGGINLLSSEHPGKAGKKGI